MGLFFHQLLPMVFSAISFFRGPKNNTPEVEGMWTLSSHHFSAAEICECSKVDLGPQMVVKFVREMGPLFQLFQGNIGEGEIWFHLARFIVLFKDTPRKINGWNLRIRAPWNFGKSSEPKHHFQGRFVNLPGCIYLVKEVSWAATLIGAFLRNILWDVRKGTNNSICCTFGFRCTALPSGWT